jgi:hypothetical protein
VEAHPVAAKSPLAAAIFVKSLLLISMILFSPSLFMRPPVQHQAFLAVGFLCTSPPTD